MSGADPTAEATAIVDANPVFKKWAESNKWPVNTESSVENAKKEFLKDTMESFFEAYKDSGGAIHPAATIDIAFLQDVAANYDYIANDKESKWECFVFCIRDIYNKHVGTITDAAFGQMKQYAINFSEAPIRDANKVSGPLEAASTRELQELIKTVNARGYTRSGYDKKHKAARFLNNTYPITAWFENWDGSGGAKSFIDTGEPSDDEARYGWALQQKAKQLIDDFEAQVADPIDVGVFGVTQEQRSFDTYRKEVLIKLDEILGTDEIHLLPDRDLYFNKIKGTSNQLYFYAPTYEYMVNGSYSAKQMKDLMTNIEASTGIILWDAGKVSGESYRKADVRLVDYHNKGQKYQDIGELSHTGPGATEGRNMAGSTGQISAGTAHQIKQGHVQINLRKRYVALKEFYAEATEFVYGRYRGATMIETFPIRYKGKQSPSSTFESIDAFMRAVTSEKAKDFKDFNPDDFSFLEVDSERWKHHRNSKNRIMSDGMRSLKQKVPLPSALTKNSFEHLKKELTEWNKLAAKGGGELDNSKFARTNKPYQSALNSSEQYGKVINTLRYRADKMYYTAEGSWGDNNMASPDKKNYRARHIDPGGDFVAWAGVSWEDCILPSRDQYKQWKEDSTTWKTYGIEDAKLKGKIVVNESKVEGTVDRATLVEYKDWVSESVGSLNTTWKSRPFRGTNLFEDTDLRTMITDKYPAPELTGTPAPTLPGGTTSRIIYDNHALVVDEKFFLNRGVLTEDAEYSALYAKLVEEDYENIDWELSFVSSGLSFLNKHEKVGMFPGGWDVRVVGDNFLFESDLLSDAQAQELGNPADWGLGRNRTAGGADMNKYLTTTIDKDIPYEYVAEWMGYLAFTLERYIGWIHINIFAAYEEVFKFIRGEIGTGTLDTPVATSQKGVYDEHVQATAYAIAVLLLSTKQSINALDIYRRLPIDKTTEGEDLKKLLAAARKKDAESFDDAAAEATKKKLAKEQIEERQMFLKQCALLLNMQMLKKEYQKIFNLNKNRNRYRLIHTIDCNDSDNRSQIVNKLTAPMYEKIAAFVESTPEIQSSLMPKARIFKVYNDKSNQILKEVELTFPRFYDPEDKAFFLGKNADAFRGGGSGIKELTWSFEGTTPATARKDIKVKLALFFQDFSEVLKERSNDSLFRNKGDGDKFKYLDLLLLPGEQAISGGIEKEFNNILAVNPSDFRIRVDVGWTIRDDKQFMSLLRERGLHKTENGNEENLIGAALKHLNKSYYLNAIDHDIKFQDDGSVDIVVEYQGYMESMTKTSAMDALTTPSLLKEKAILNREYHNLIKSKRCENKSTLEELLLTYNAIEVNFIKLAHQSIVQRLVNRGKMHYCKIERADVNSFQKNGFYTSKPHLYLPKSIPTISKKTKVTTEKKAEKKQAGSTEPTTYKQVLLDSNYVNFKKLAADGGLTKPKNAQEFVTFFFLGDLIDVVMDNFYDPDKKKIYPHLKNTKVILSSFNYIDLSTNLNNINISEIPVATEWFFEWMNQNVVKPERRNYPLMNFIRDICNKLIVDLMLETCINRDPVKTLRFNSTTLLGKGAYSTESKKYIDPLLLNKTPRINNTIHIDATKAHKEGIIPFKTDLGSNDLENCFNYIVIYPVTNIKKHEGVGNQVEDGKNGIYHFGIGKNTGIVKRIDFAKTDIQYLREARYYNHGHNGLMQLGAVYKCTLEMFGNTIFYPGMQIFIDPRGLSGQDFDPTKKSSVANQLGFGGYHLITRVNSSIKPGAFDTTIEAQFVYSGDGSTDGVKTAEEEKQRLGAKSKEEIFQSNKIDSACARIVFLRQKRLNTIDIIEPGKTKDYSTLSDEQIQSEYNSYSKK